MGRLLSEVQMLTQTILGFVMLGHVTAAWAIPVLACTPLIALTPEGKDSVTCSPG